MSYEVRQLSTLENIHVPIVRACANYSSVIYLLAALKFLILGKLMMFPLPYQLLISRCVLERHKQLLLICCVQSIPQE